ncbi:MAG TPA: hypothetical protein VIN06_07070 [Devosia sp.]
MRLLAAAVPMLFVASAVFAQDTAALQNLAACRAGAATVDLSFTYTGGGCEETEPATVAIEGPVGKVTVPTRSTAEVCTMQATPIDVAQMIEAPAVTALEIELLNPQGQVSATGNVAVEPECSQG